MESEKQDNRKNSDGAGFCESKLQWDNRSLQRLPLDESEGTEATNSSNMATPTSRTVRGCCFSLVKPQPVRNPRLVAFSRDALRLLYDDSDEGVSKSACGSVSDELTEYEEEQLVRFFSGNSIMSGARPAAHCYAGMQHYCRQLVS